MNFEKFLIDFQLAQTKNLAFVVVTLVNSKGSAPQEIGARMIVSNGVYFSGTVGGGKLELAAITKAKELLDSKARGSHFVEWNLQTDIKMTCGGVVSLFFEIHNLQSRWRIVIFGAGHVSQELVRVLLQLECNIQCFDTRPDWLAKLPSDPKLEVHLSQELKAEIAKLPEDSFVILATMGHASDLPILEEILRTKQFSYVGVLGSDQKASKMRQYFKDLQMPSAIVDSFFCPIGENIGDNTPAEISISICSQLLKIRDQVFNKEVKSRP